MVEDFQSQLLRIESISFSPARALSPHRKRKASNDFIEWWLRGQQRHGGIGEDPNLQLNFSEPNLLNMLSGTLIPSSSNICTCPEQKLRTMVASKGVKRPFDLHSDSTCSIASTNAAPVIFESSDLFRKRAKTDQTTVSPRKRRYFLDHRLLPSTRKATILEWKLQYRKARRRFSERSRICHSQTGVHHLMATAKSAYHPGTCL